MLAQIFECLSQATNGDALDLSVESSQRHMMSAAYSQQKTSKFIEAQQVLDTELPPPTAAQIHKLIIESVCSFVDNFILIFDFNGFKIGSQSTQAQKRGASMQFPPLDGPSSKMPLQSSIMTSTKSDAGSQCKELLNTSWKPLLSVLSNLLRTTQEESNLQTLLNCFQNFIGVCGSLANRAGQLPYDARDAFLETLCSFCLTPAIDARQSLSGHKTSTDFNLTEKNIQICKTLLNIAHCLGYMLDVRSWYIILDTMQRIETVIKNAKTKRMGGGMINRTAPTINQATGA